MRKRKRKCTEKPTADNDDVVLERRVMIMMTLLFLILFFGVFGRLIGFAFRASWSIMKVMLVIVFLPAILMVLLFGGLIYIALPILIVVGLVNLFSRA